MEQRAGIQPSEAGTPADDLAGILAEAARLEDEGARATLCTIVRATGSTPRGVGARMIVYPDGHVLGTIGGGALEKNIVDRCIERQSSEPEVLDLVLGDDVGMTCGGAVGVLVEPLGRSPWLLVFGGGHIAQALTPMAARAGFRIAVVDELASFASSERFPEASRLVLSFESTDWSSLPLDDRAHAVIVTRGHVHDTAVLGALVERDLPYVGMIGSRNKVAQAFQTLRERGVPDERLARVHAPIGLDIGAETPAEIAVSILAEVIAVRRGRGK